MKNLDMERNVADETVSTANQKQSSRTGAGIGTEPGPETGPGPATGTGIGPATLPHSVWHPFTQAKIADPELKVTSGDGIYLQLEDGRRVIDCISSWWVNLHGHANPIIARAIYEQAMRLEHVIFAGFTHEPAEQLATRLLAHLPENINHVFYSDNGSTSVEVALKMACQYWHNQGTPRTRFLAFEGGYHGDTFGAMSAGRSSNFFDAFAPLLFDVDTLPYPSTFDNDSEVETKENQSITRFRSLLEENQNSYAAIILEPLIQGAAGMRMCRPEFLRKLETAAREFGILVIYDEVMTGFGRTGDWFACNKADTTPDIICLSKGITGGFLPLSVTTTSSKIYDSFLGDDLQKAFLHGHSYTANPLACAAALASLDLLEANSANFLEVEYFHRALFQKYLSGITSLRNHRFCGAVAAFDVTTSDGTNYFDSIGTILRKRFLERDLLIRPLGNTIYLMPPYCISLDQLEFVYQQIQEVLHTLEERNEA
ncbi:MAG: adenosylmethionine--8-amino-7-oxononanoate transaminase [Candidatus Melainabacteria bacterium]|nr:adenosylmethionine--8-amino-7-oxononanoate transaminase [Candidatus Melainabacteria bacterium]